MSRARDYLGFGLQSEKNCRCEPDTWFPLREGDDLAYMQPINRPGSTVGRLFSQLYPPTSISPGTIPALLDWMLERDDERQGRWATVVSHGGGVVVSLQNAKVESARLQFRAGQPAHLRDLSFIALDKALGLDILSPPPRVAPYVFKKAWIEGYNSVIGLATEEETGVVVVNIETALERGYGEASRRSLRNTGGGEGHWVGVPGGTGR